MELYKEGQFCFYKENDIIDEMILTGYDLDAEMNEMESRGISGIWLNRYFCDKRINDLSFLKEHPNITKVYIVDDDFDCRVISEMTQLKCLQIQTAKSIDFSRLENLNILISNTIGTKGLPPNIEVLHLWDYKFQDGSLKTIRFPNSLKCLELNKNSLTSLSGLPGGLQRLGIYYDRKLMSLCGLEASGSSIEELEVNHCPNLIDYSSLQNCSNLRKLILIKSGNIPSLSLLETAKGLKHLTLAGVLVLDKDLSYASSIPHTYITNMRYYRK